MIGGKILRGIFVGVDSTIEVKNYDLSQRETLKMDLGGLMERVKPRGLPREFCFVCNDEGLLVGLPENKIATKLYQYPYIAGNIVIFKEGFVNSGIDFVEMTDEDVEIILTVLDRIKD